MERSHPLPARLCVLEKETLFVSCWIWGFICNLENPTAPRPPFCYPTRGCSWKVQRKVSVHGGENTAWLTLAAQTFKRSPHSETLLLLPPVFLQLEENVFKQSAVIMGLGSRVRNPGIECILAIWPWASSLCAQNLSLFMCIIGWLQVSLVERFQANELCANELCDGDW